MPRSRKPANVALVRFGTRSGLVLASFVVLAVAALALWRQQGGDASRGPSTERDATGPRVLVPGERGIQQPRASFEDERIDPAALRAAADYAAERDSTALIVGRHGHIVFEQYWKGTNRDTVVDAGAFARTVAAMMVGVALEDRGIRTIDDAVTRYPGAAAAASPGITLRQLLQAEDAQPLVAFVERLSGRPYAAYLSRMLWKPLSAGDAWLVLDRPGGTPRVDCCFHARQEDWLRIAQLLSSDGEYQGSRILPPGWTASMLAPSARDPEFGFQVWVGTPRETFHLRGEGKSRLWLHPGLGLAVLRLGSEPGDWDENRIPTLVIAGVIDRPQPARNDTGVDLSKLVPNH